MQAASGVPLIDLGQWFDGDQAQRAELVSTLDGALQRVGFLVVTGHQIPPQLSADVRAAATAFFALPPEFKRAYQAKVGGRGWLAIGAEANGYSEGTLTAPDLKESFVVGPDDPTVTGTDSAWFAQNVWPQEVPALRGLLEAYNDQMHTLAQAVLRMCALALGQPERYFADKCLQPSWSFQANWYPPAVITGAPKPDQYRIGPHTDFGTITVLDRQPGAGGLQIDIEGEGWVDAPYVPDSLVINTGDLLAHWTGARWKSNRHRVLPPPVSDMTEELLSLVYFYEADPVAIIDPLPIAHGGRMTMPPVRAGDFLRERYDAITLSESS